MNSSLKKFFLSLFVAIFFLNALQAQNNKPFWNEVQQFKKLDSSSAPPKNQILFIGSSSFTLWKDVNDYFPGYKILNRAFGGSTLQNLIDYVDIIAYPYQPRQIVMYCGENDFASSDTMSVSTVVNRFKTMYALLRQKFKKVPFAYVSMKPSISREKLLVKYAAANKAIENFLKTEKYTAYIDIYYPMLNNQGKPLAHIFLNDNLHMNKEGYQIWQKIMLPYLEK